MHYLWIVIILLLTIALILLYSNSYKYEKFIFLKLIGYLLLGAFIFPLYFIPVPIGLFLYALFFRSYINRKWKRYAVFIGLVFIFIVYFIISINQYAEHSSIKVSSFSKNIYQIDFYSDWLSLKEKLEANDLSVAKFQMEYMNDGNIKELSYDLVNNVKEDFIVYSIQLLPSKGTYEVIRSKGKELDSFSTLIPAKEFFKYFSKIDFKSIEKEKAYGSYTIYSDGQLASYNMKDREKYLIDENGNIKDIGVNQLPVIGYYFSFFGTNRIDNFQENKNSTVYENSKIQDYFYKIFNNTF